MIKNEFAPIVLLRDKEDSFLDKVLEKAQEYAPDIPISKDKLCIVSTKQDLEKTHNPYVLIIWGVKNNVSLIENVDCDRVYTYTIKDESVPLIIVDRKNPVKGFKKAIEVFKERIK